MKSNALPFAFQQFLLPDPMPLFPWHYIGKMDNTSQCIVKWFSLLNTYCFWFSNAFQGALSSISCTSKTWWLDAIKFLHHPGSFNIYANTIAAIAYRQCFPHAKVNFFILYTDSFNSSQFEVCGWRCSKINASFRQIMVDFLKSIIYNVHERCNLQKKVFH